MAKRGSSGRKPPAWLKNALVDLVRKGPLILAFDPEQSRVRTSNDRKGRGRPRIVKIIPRELRLQYDGLMDKVQRKIKLFEISSTGLLVEKAKGDLADPIRVVTLAERALATCIQYRKARIKLFQWVRDHPEVLTSRKDLQKIRVDINTECQAMFSATAELYCWRQRKKLLQPKKT